MRGHHGISPLVLDAAGQQLQAAHAAQLPTRNAIGGEALLDLFPKLLRHDCRMLACVGFSLVYDLADVDLVLQQVIEGAPSEGLSAMGIPAAGDLELADDGSVAKVDGQLRNTAQLQVASIDRSCQLCF